MNNRLLLVDSVVGNQSTTDEISNEDYTPKCYTCGNNYVDNEALKNHIKNGNCTNAERKNQCQICNSNHNDDQPIQKCLNKKIENIFNLTISIFDYVVKNVVKNKSFNLYNKSQQNITKNNQEQFNEIEAQANLYQGYNLIDSKFNFDILASQKQIYINDSKTKKNIHCHSINNNQLYLPSLLINEQILSVEQKQLKIIDLKHPKNSYRINLNNKIDKIYNSLNINYLLISFNSDSSNIYEIELDVLDQLTSNSNSNYFVEHEFVQKRQRLTNPNCLLHNNKLDLQIACQDQQLQLQDKKFNLISSLDDEKSKIKGMYTFQKQIVVSQNENSILQEFDEVFKKLVIRMKINIQTLINQTFCQNLKQLQQGNQFVIASRNKFQVQIQNNEKAQGHEFELVLEKELKVDDEIVGIGILDKHNLMLSFRKNHLIFSLIEQEDHLEESYCSQENDAIRLIDMIKK